MRVTAENLAFAYPDGPTLFDDRNFDLAPGTRVALCGVQGSGVSSLLDLLFAVRQPTQGHISLDGLDLRNWQLDRLRESVELLRRDEIVDGTVADNLRLGRPDIGMDEVRTALDRVGLLDDVLNHPDGLNLRLKVGGGPLSTSQRVRLLCARAIVQQPRLLLIDELLDGLDENTFDELAKAMLANDEPWTVIIATRLKDVAALCDDVIELSPALQESRRVAQDMALSS